MIWSIGPFKEKLIWPGITMSNGVAQIFQPLSRPLLGAQDSDGRTGNVLHVGEDKKVLLSMIVSNWEGNSSGADGSFGRATDADDRGGGRGFVVREVRSMGAYRS